MVRAAIDRFPPAPVERLCFGTPDASAIAARLDEFLRRELGAGIDEPCFYVTSVGCVLGAVLDDRRRVVVKAHQPGSDPDQLAAVQRVQRHLGAHGFPAPAPIAGPAPLVAGLATVETMLEGGAIPDARQPSIRRAIATWLRRLLTLTAGFARDPALARRVIPRGDPARVFPPPHSPVFDFEATRDGAEWIEALGAEAAAVVDDEGGAAEVVSHVDWRVEHLRSVGDRLVAVFDWDSLRTDREAAAVGQVAHGFTIDWGAAEAHVPTLDEAAAFVRDYERARGAPFTDREWRVAKAAWVYATAYGARCEHALLGAAVAPVPGAFRARLAAHGAEWLR